MAGGRGVHGRGHAWWGACVQMGACMVGGACVAGGMRGRGYMVWVCLAEGYAWQGDVHGRGHAW